MKRSVSRLSQDEPTLALPPLGLAFARQGVGRTIFRECAQAAAKAGAMMFQAYSSPNAEPFYARLGVTRIKQIDLPRPSTAPIPAILMEGAIKVEG